MLSQTAIKVKFILHSAVFFRIIFVKGGRFMSKAFNRADILLPKDVDMHRWSVVACDQYTSEPEYWSEVEKTVGEAVSTLKITLPEIYLEDEGVAEKIEKINSAMLDYINRKIFAEHKQSYIYLERTLADGTVRQGIVGMVDLEEYDFSKGSQSLVRATEGTVLERIPPRVRIRENAALELPHVMLLIDDEEKKIIEPLADSELEKVYDFELMQGGGHVRGYLIKDADALDKRLAELAERSVFEAKYGVSDKGVLQYAVGDGNHSLATAKTCWEALKAQGVKEHPARFALAEIVNLHSDALKFEPIHRVLFDVDTENFIKEFKNYLCADSTPDKQWAEVVVGDKKEKLYIHSAKSNLAVGSVQNFIDRYLEKFGGKVDYIHGDEVVYNLAKGDGCVGILLGAMQKSDLFPTVILDGALPRKTFSMGHACDKRFYLECRKIK